MAGNSFGTIFRITTWGESHGPGLGVVIDGCPAGIPLSREDIQKEVDRRKPTDPKITTPRKEADEVEILSGIFEGVTTGMPISLMVRNQNQESKDYGNIKDVYRPGHADYTYQVKYGIRDHRGGGRSSGRETVARVMAGAVAKKILATHGIQILGHTIQVGEIQTKMLPEETLNPEIIERNVMRCADTQAAEAMRSYVEKLREEGDSSGALIELRIQGVPPGLGEPCFDKINADLAKAIFSIPTIKGVSFGEGFNVATMKGSENNDIFTTGPSRITTKTNHAGGTLGGISSGENIVIKIAIKPPSSISKKQETINKEGQYAEIEIKGRHDACLAPRVIPVAESMAALVVVDHLLRQKVNLSSKI